MAVAFAQRKDMKILLTGPTIGVKKVVLIAWSRFQKKNKFYQQEYCGCAYSLRDTNQHRIKQGRKPIKIGVKFYGDGDQAPSSS